VQLNDAAKEKLAFGARAGMIWLKSQADLVSTRDRYGDLARGLSAYVEEKGEFPRGTVARGDNPATGLPYRPDQRLSFYATLLPYLGDEVARWGVDPGKNWTEEPNFAFASRVLPPVLAHRMAGLSPPVVNYPGTDNMFGATHFVGMAGVGMDAPEYQPGNPKAGVFGYDRVTKKGDVKDGLDKTIALILVPADLKAPWLAGGGATVRGIPEEGEDNNPLASFVCMKHRNT